MITRKIGFIGAGQMARALAGGFVGAGLVDPAQLAVTDLVPAALEQFAAQVDGVRALPDNPTLIASVDLVFLAVKPQKIGEVAGQLDGDMSPDKLLVSIAAGVSIERLCSHFATDRVIRVMPNTPCLVGQGASAFALGDGAGRNDAAIVDQLMASVGVSIEVDEGLLDAVTGLSGSGPAFVYTMIEALSDGGVRMGLPRSAATKLAAQTVLGAAQMVLSTGEHPAVLRDRVASPGGTTIAGLQALEDHGLRAALIGGVQAATQRSIELASGE